MAVPYWRLSGFYFSYFLVVGTIFPFWSLYLQSLDFTAQQIGIVVASLTVTKIISPNLWAWLSDKTGRRLLMIRFGAVAGCLAFSSIFVSQTFTWILAVALVFSFFWNAILSQFEVVTLAYLAQQPERYGQVRLWGSVSFIVAVVALGAVFDYLDIHFLPAIILAFLALIAVSSFTVGERTYSNAKTSGNHFFARLKQPQIAAFFLACLLLEMSLGTYYTFFSVYLDGYGYSRFTTGMLWALGVAAEIGVFLVTHRLLSRLGVYWLFVASLLATALRWVLLAKYAEIFSVLLFSQLLHVCSFATAHAACVEWIRRTFKGEQGHALAFYSASSFGVGGALGALISGYLWDVDPQAAFLLSAVMAGVGGLIAWLFWYRA